MEKISSYKEAILVGCIRIGANLLMIGALFLAMYLASTGYGSGMLTFCLCFFGITIPVWIAAWYAVKYVRRLAKNGRVSFIVLPGDDEPCLVEWKVIDGAKKR